MLIHQSRAAADEFAWAESAFTWPRDFGHPRSGAECLQERWDNRKALFGMHLYPGVGDDDGFGPEARLLQIAQKLARDASQQSTVLPEKDQTTGEYGDVWALRKPAGAVAAYFAKRDAMFFWGPADGPGWDLFEQCEIRLVPIDYDAVNNAVVDTSGGTPEWMKSGGGPMWMEPRTGELLKQLHDLAK